MIIDFKSMEEKVNPQFKGGEKEFKVRMHQDENNKIMYGKLEPGASIGSHTHETNSEIIYILEGTGITIYDGEEEEVQPGTCHYCPKGHVHSLINNGNRDLIFFAVVPEQ